MITLIANILLMSPQIECPRVLPGSNTPCIAAAFGRYTVERCKQKTAAWILRNLALPNNWAQAGGAAPIPNRAMPMNIREVR